MDDLPILATCPSGILAILSSEGDIHAKFMEALGNA